jgi:hypothetical protein
MKNSNPKKRTRRPAGNTRQTKTGATRNVLAGQEDANRPLPAPDAPAGLETERAGLQARKAGTAELQPAPDRQGHALLELEYGSRDEMRIHMIADAKKITGVKWALASERLVNYLANGLVWSPVKDSEDAALQALVLLDEFEPQNFTEASLAASTIAVNEAGLLFLRRATTGAPEAIDLNMARATRLLRLHLDQIEAMQKLKGKAGQQKVTVEHVTVNAGGQAIVGAVEAAKGAPGSGGQ